MPHMMCASSCHPSQAWSGDECLHKLTCKPDKYRRATRRRRGVEMSAYISCPASPTSTLSACRSATQTVASVLDVSLCLSCAECPLLLVATIRCRRLLRVATRRPCGPRFPESDHPGMSLEPLD
eukprot:5200047-Prymnesium_polylepis.2